MDEALGVVRLVLAATFAVAGVAKLFDLAGARAAVAGFGVPERLAVPLGTLLPLAEIAVAVLLLDDGTARAGAVAALGLLLAFCLGIGVSLARGEAPDCHCFGQLHSEPAGPRTLARNGVLAATAAFAAFAGTDPGLDLLPSPGDFEAELALALGGALALAVALAIGTLAYLQLLRNHGRLLLRIEALEGLLRDRGIPIPAAADPRLPGLAVGTPAPDFSLTGIDGAPYGLSGLRSSGRPLVLLFTDPGCGPCKALVPKVAEWQREHAGRLSLVPISRGTVDATARELARDFHGPVLVETRREVSERYEARATPSAVLIDAQGRIATPVAAGDDAVAALVERAVTGTQLPLRRAGPALGPRPGDELPREAEVRDLDGVAVPLAEALGERPRIVLFWDPNCGFCRRMLPDLLEFEAHNPDRVKELLLISRGEAAANRAQGITAQTVLDDGLAVGRAVSFRGTPSAFRVAPDGTVTSGYAVGADEVLKLARAS